MSFIHSVILGIIQGITEFLPVSSTGHLVLASHFLKIPQSEFLKSFEIAIQSGTILAVVALYWRRLFFDLETLKRLLVAFFPTGVLGLLVYKIVKHYLLGNTTVVIWALFLGGIFLILFEIIYRTRSRDSRRGQACLSPTSDDVRLTTEDAKPISYKQAFLIGCFQSLAMIPGVSRSAATILGGLGLGLPRKTIVEFSFLLAVPTLLAATALDLLKTSAVFSAKECGLLFAGAAVSFVVAIFVIRLFLRFIRGHSFIPFGIYRIGLAVLSWFVK